jgi:hypothetical protein
MHRKEVRTTLACGRRLHLADLPAAAKRAAPAPCGRRRRRWRGQKLSNACVNLASRPSCRPSGRTPCSYLSDASVELRGVAVEKRPLPDRRLCRSAPPLPAQRCRFAGSVGSPNCKGFIESQNRAARAVTARAPAAGSSPARWLPGGGQLACAPNLMDGPAREVEWAMLSSPSPRNDADRIGIYRIVAVDRPLKTNFCTR